MFIKFEVLPKFEGFVWITCLKFGKYYREIEKLITFLDIVIPHEIREISAKLIQKHEMVTKRFPWKTE